MQHETQSLSCSHARGHGGHRQHAAVEARQARGGARRHLRCERLPLGCWSPLTCPVLLQRMPVGAHCPSGTAAGARQSARGAALASSTLTSRTLAAALRLLHSMSAWPCCVTRAVSPHLVLLKRSTLSAYSPGSSGMLTLRGFSAKDSHLTCSRCAGSTIGSLDGRLEALFSPATAGHLHARRRRRPRRAHLASPSHADPPGAMTGHFVR